MKKSKQLLALLLAALTLCACMLPAAAQEPKLTHAEAHVVTPVIGARIDTLTVTSAAPEKYAAEAKVYYWKTVDGKSQAYYPTADETFLKGVTYVCRVTFPTKDGLKFDVPNTTCVINGKKLGNPYSNFSDRPGWEIYLNPKTQTEVDAEEAAYAKGETGADTESAGSCPYCGEAHNGFIQKIIGFFHQILFRLFGAKNK